jgi:hypothetical protein
MQVPRLRAVLRRTTAPVLRRTIAIGYSLTPGVGTNGLRNVTKAP